jgi:hypothetical protein
MNRTGRPEKRTLRGDGTNPEDEGNGLYYKQNSEERAKSVDKIFDVSDEALDEIFAQRAYQAIMRHPDDEKLVKKVFDRLDPRPQEKLHAKLRAEGYDYLEFERQFTEDARRMAEDYKEEARQQALLYELRTVQNERIKNILKAIENASSVTVDESSTSNATSTASSSIVQVGLFNSAMSLFGLNQSSDHSK